MKLHQVLTGAANTFDDKAAIAVGNVEDYPFTVSFKNYICVAKYLNNVYNIYTV